MACALSQARAFAYSIMCAGEKQCRSECFVVVFCVAWAKKDFTAASLNFPCLAASYVLLQELQEAKELCGLVKFLCHFQALGPRPLDKVIFHRCQIRRC